MGQGDAIRPLTEVEVRDERIHGASTQLVHGLGGRGARPHHAHVVGTEGVGEGGSQQGIVLDEEHVKHGGATLAPGRVRRNAFPRM